MPTRVTMEMPMTRKLLRALTSNRWRKKFVKFAQAYGCDVTDIKRPKK